MRRRPLPPGHPGTPISIRFAWWAAFLVTLALVFAFTQARSASAALLPAPAAALSAAVLSSEEEEAESEEAEAEWEYEDECETFGEGEEEEFCEEEVGDADGTPPECLLSSAEATVSALPARDTVRLQIRYTAHSAVAVKVDYRLRGGKGRLQLGADRRRFEKAGTFRASRRLTEAQMAKVLAARDFTVELGAVNTPRYCHRYFDQKLTVKRAGGSGFTWSEPAARAAARADG